MYNSELKFVLQQLQDTLYMSTKRTNIQYRQPVWKHYIGINMEYKMGGVRILHLLCLGNILGIVSMEGTWHFELVMMLYR